ncbi:sulfurtransferase TusA family protein [Oxalobacter paraformigenes]|uniref:UPF0033 domain-containing protein n=1 Tax=Oxalobacter paraformigenes TaxID=556268 RepID=C3X1L8_9BURK|nr:sulfurtransferase TusA family protein [Oxalobacter paraformigenes]EEO27104.2 hypothetical protein OFAG_00257 [Oxalobacter paraformigenes]
MEDRELKHADLTVDACGTKCPMPILKAKKALANMESGQLLKVLATDPGAVRDFHFFGSQTGNEVVGEAEENGIFTIIVKRK